ncbi:hypothetical protein FACS1894109_06990 [Spirochaetia bacterium]|nr:hypothetical protein FACS1894109_06990 [Spirochaetia bacterium]
MSLIKDWNPKQAVLKEAIADANAKPERFKEAIRLCLELHGSVHSAPVSNTKPPTIFDKLWDGLSRRAFETMPSTKGVTIAWNIWHLIRIEDITANILICNGKQVLNGTWLKKLKVAVRDTGNAMTKDEILNLSRSLNMDALLAYRNAVGSRTREIIGSLKPADLKRKMNPASVQRILTEGGVTGHKDSVWLLDFWSKKTVAGILLMPITRHQIVHLNDCTNLKEKIMRQRETG